MPPSTSSRPDQWLTGCSQLRGSTPKLLAGRQHGRWSICRHRCTCPDDEDPLVTDWLRQQQQEHSVMYPIDLLKVCTANANYPSSNFDPFLDTHASRQSNTRRRLHRSIARHRYDITSGRLQVSVEGSFERDCGSRYNGRATK